MDTPRCWAKAELKRTFDDCGREMEEEVRTSTAEWREGNVQLGILIRMFFMKVLDDVLSHNPTFEALDKKGLEEVLGDLREELAYFLIGLEAFRVMHEKFTNERILESIRMGLRQKIESAVKRVNTVLM